MFQQEKTQQQSNKSPPSTPISFMVRALCINDRDPSRLAGRHAQKQEQIETKAINMNATETSQRLTQTTEPGRVTDWNERIAEIARLTNCKMCLIAWTEAPSYVAYSVTKYFDVRGKLHELNDAIARWQLNRDKESNCTANSLEAGNNPIGR